MQTDENYKFLTWKKFREGGKKKKPFCSEMSRCKDEMIN